MMKGFIRQCITPLLIFVSSLGTMSMGWCQVSLMTTPPPIVKSPPSQMFYETQLRVDRTVAWFRIPRIAPAYSIMTIDYSIAGYEVTSAVEANAFEITDKSVAKGLSSSALPQTFRFSFKYKGALPLTNTTTRSVLSEPRFLRYYDTNTPYLQRILLENTGRCIFKSRGLGMVSVRMRILDPTGKPVIPGWKYTQPIPEDMYPGDSTLLYFQLEPLPPGKYVLSFQLLIHNGSALHSWDAGQPVAETVTDIESLTPPVPVAGGSIPRNIDYPYPVTFPDSFYSWEEDRQAIQIHALGKGEAKGQLFLRAPGRDRFVNVRLITEKGVANAGWNVKFPVPQIDKKDIAKLRKNPTLLLDYRPEVAARFTPDVDSTLRTDLKTLKSLEPSGIFIPMYLLLDPVEKTPLLKTLEICRKQRLKIIPILFRDDQRNALLSWAQQQPTKQVKKSDKSESVPDPTFSEILLKFYQKEVQPWNDLFYRHKGKTMVVLRDASSFGLWERFPDLTETHNLLLQQWLKNRYVDTYKLNLEWDTQYKDFSEIKALDIFQQWDNPTSSFQEGKPVWKDLDLFRSEILARELRNEGTLLQKEGIAWTGTLSDILYGVDSLENESPFAGERGRITAARAGQMEEPFWSIGKPDFVGFYAFSNFDEIDSLARFVRNKNSQPLILTECGEMTWKYPATLNNLWTQVGGWWGIPKVEARDFRRPSNLFARLMEANRSEGIPGVFGWNRTNHLSWISDAQIQQIRDYNQVIH